MASSDTKAAGASKSPAEIPPVPEEIGKLPTKAASIRALAALGWERAVIAKALGVRYQQVSNTLGPIKKPAAVTKAARKATPEAPKRAPEPEPERVPEPEAPKQRPERKPEPAIGIAAEGGEPAANPFPVRHLWRLPGIVAFGAIATFLLGLLWLIALSRLVVRLAGTPGEEMLASAERSLSAWLMQILDYLRGTDHIDDLPFPFTRLP